MEPNDCITKDCSTIYRFQFASIAFLCSVYLPFTFHSNIWSLYSQPFTPVNCSIIKTSSFVSESISNITKRSLVSNVKQNLNRTDCCPCNGILNGNSSDKRLWTLCQQWLANFHEIEVRKATVIDEVSLSLKR
jgi:hypothetical protein